MSTATPTTATPTRATSPKPAAPRLDQTQVHLTCRECGNKLPAQPTAVCPDCFGGLEVTYDYDELRTRVSRASIEAGPRSLWRYAPLLPINTTPLTGQHSGMTPLRRADRLAKELGLKELWIKDDSANYPTWSYKERVVSVAITKAVEFGFTTVACASTGNLANSVAAHAAAAGLKCVVFIPHDLESNKVVGSLIFGPQVVRINGNYDDVNRLCAEVADDLGWAIVNVNLRPFYTEGAKTLGFEIAEQLGWRLPDHTILPTAGGTVLPKVAKAYDEFVKLGLVAEKSSKIHSAQAEGCSPVVKAIQEGNDEIFPQKPHTIAKSIAIGNPADGHVVLDVVRKTGGWGAMANDTEIIDAVRLLARTEGIWTEPAGGTTLAATIKLIRDGHIKPDESVVVCITGNGLKAPEAVAPTLPWPDVIEPKVEALLAEVGLSQGTAI